MNLYEVNVDQLFSTKMNQNNILIGQIYWPKLLKSWQRYLDLLTPVKPYKVTFGSKEDMNTQNTVNSVHPRCKYNV